MAGTFTYTSGGQRPERRQRPDETVTFTPTRQHGLRHGQATVTVNVAQATPTLSVSAVDITYGTALADSQLSSDTASWTVADLDQRGRLVHLHHGGGQRPERRQRPDRDRDLHPGDSTDYTTATATVTVNVAQATPTLSVSPVGITYGTALADSHSAATRRAGRSGPRPPWPARSPTPARAGS